MRGCYTLALPELLALGFGSALTQGRSVAGYYSRFAAERMAEMAREVDSNGSARV